MRTLHATVLIAVLGCACAHTGQRDQGKWERATAASLGVSRKEVAEMARAAIGDQKMVVVLMKKEDDRIIEVYIAETMTSGHGTIVRYHRVNGRWEELDTGEIVKWME